MASNSRVPPGLSGFQRTATRDTVGTISLRISSRFAASSVERNVMPVTLAPGRARLATRPAPTGSPAATITMGIVDVAGPSGGIDRGVASRHDHVHLALDQPGGENVDSPRLSLAERILDREVSPLDVAKLAQGAAPRLQVRFRELGGASPEHSDVRHFVRRLRLDSERRSEEAHGQEDREDAPRNSHTSPHSKSRWF